MYEHRNLFIDEAIVIVKHILILALGVGSSLRARRKVIQLTVPSEKRSCNIFGWLASAAPPGALDMNCTRVGLSLRRADVWSLVAHVSYLEASSGRYVCSECSNRATAVN